METQKKQYRSIILRIDKIIELWLFVTKKAMKELSLIASNIISEK